MLVVWAVMVTATAAAASEAAVSDAYIEGYAAALLEAKFGVSAGSLRVRDAVITLRPSDLAGADREQIVAALQRIRGVARVDVTEPPPAPDRPPAAEDATQPRPAPAWRTGPMPGGLLFAPLLADPRWPHFAVSHQRYVNDPDFGNVAAVSFGETFTLYRGPLGPDLWEVGLQGGVFSIFDLDAASFDLINADYFVAAVLGYRHDEWSALARVFHQSSHLGDEFLLRRSRIDRVNLSYEGLDVKLSWETRSNVLRLYGGAGYLFDREPADLKPWSLQYGVEFRSPWPGPGARFQPIAAADVQHREENGWRADLSLRAGVQFEGPVLGRNLELLVEYFRGHSPNGQFYRREIDYVGLGVHFHL